MKPVDGHGRPIHSLFFNWLKEHGRVLEQAGYVETAKPNLFMREYAVAKFVACLRGLDVPVRKDMRPKIYPADPDWREKKDIRNAFRIELARLSAMRVAYRVDPRDQRVLRVLREEPLD